MLLHQMLLKVFLGINRKREDVETPKIKNKTVLFNEKWWDNIYTLKFKCFIIPKSLQSNTLLSSPNWDYYSEDRIIGTTIS